MATGVMKNLAWSLLLRINAVFLLQLLAFFFFFLNVKKYQRRSARTPVRLNVRAKVRMRSRCSGESHMLLANMNLKRTLWLLAGDSQTQAAKETEESREITSRLSDVTPTTGSSSESKHERALGVYVKRVTRGEVTEASLSSSFI